MRWKSLARVVIGAAVVVGLAVLFIRQLRRAEPDDFVLPVALPALMLGVAGVAEVQARLGGWLVRRSAARPPGDAAADFDEGEPAEGPARTLARSALGCLRGTALTILWLPLLFSPGLAAVLTTAQQAEKGQHRAITAVYGEAAYAAGLRIKKDGTLNTGAPADPRAVDLLHRRPVLPELAAVFLTLLTADWLLRRYFGEGYNGQRPLIDPDKVRDAFRRPPPNERNRPRPLG